MLNTITHTNIKTKYRITTILNKLFTDGITKSSTERRGIISLDKLKQKNLESKLDSIYIGFPDFYGRLSTVKVDADYFLSNYEHGFTLDSSILHSDIDGLPIKDPNRKLILKPDTKVINEMAWLKSKSFLVYGNVYNSIGGNLNLYPFSPRNILIKKIDELSDLGYKVKGASELEFYLYTKRYNENYSKGLTKLKEFGSHAEDYLIQQGDRFENIYEKFRTKLRDSGVPVESMKGEASIGQHEINVAFGDALETSDNILILKTCLKCIADSFNTTITFMAKPNKDRFGTSSHLHVSLHDLSDGTNVFQGTECKLNENISCSNVMRHFLGGLMKYSLDIFILFAPTINSYKRFKNSLWTPSNLDNWSVDNRTAPFRICGSGKSLRIELRMPGGDINQYLAYAGLIAAGIEGIRNKIEPPVKGLESRGDFNNVSTSGAAANNLNKNMNHNLNINTCTITTANHPNFISDSTIPKKSAPVDMLSALKLFESSEFINKSFGNDVHEHLINFYRHEVDINERNVTKWEYSRYLDLI